MDNPNESFLINTIQNEERNFVEQMEMNNDLSEKDKNRVYCWLNSGLCPNNDVVLILKKVNHVYVHAILAFHDLR